MRRVADGLAPAPLPRRWWRGLSRKQIRRVVRTETSGTPRLCPARHPKGYVYVYIGRGHPYATRAGYSYLHRWLMQRRLGRKLAAHEHVHHADGADKATTDPSKLEVLESTTHGLYHWNRFVRCQGCVDPAEDFVG